MMASRTLLRQPRSGARDPMPTHTHAADYGGTLRCLTLLACLGASCAIVLPSTPCDAMSSPPLLETGSIPIANTHNASMFYWLVRTPSPSPQQPLGLWFHGGPGCSAALAFFFEHGPYRFVNNSLCYGFRHAWVEAGMSMVYVDSPLGTGFSYSPDAGDLARNETVVGAHIVRFVQGLYDRYPEFAGRPLFLLGVSYAGHMLPNAASALLRANRDGAFDPPLALQGVSLGNPWLSPVHQYGAYADFARRRGLLSDGAAADMATRGVQLCNVSLAACHDGGGRATCLNAWRVCQGATFDVIVRSNPGINVYDITKRCRGPFCYDFSALDLLLRQPGTQRLLKVPEGSAWTGACSGPAHEALMPDWPQDYLPLLGSLLDAGLRVLVYAGMDDLTCPWLGLERALQAMPWRGRAAFAAAPPAALLLNGVLVGQERRAGALTFATVERAGHEVPMDQPAVALQLIARFVRGAQDGAASQQ